MIYSTWYHSGLVFFSVLYLPIYFSRYSWNNILSFSFSHSVWDCSAIFPRLIWSRSSLASMNCSVSILRSEISSSGSTSESIPLFFFSSNASVGFSIWITFPSAVSLPSYSRICASTVSFSSSTLRSNSPRDFMVFTHSFICCKSPMPTSSSIASTAILRKTSPSPSVTKAAFVISAFSASRAKKSRYRNLSRKISSSEKLWFIYSRRCSSVNFVVPCSVP